MLADKLIRIDHVLLTVPLGKIPEARKFYLEVIGLPEDAKPESMQVNLGFFMKVQDGQIHVIQEDAAIDRSATKAHIGLNVGSVEFLRACRGRLEAAGIKTSEMPHFPGYERYDFRDPFGNRLEFIAPLPS